MIFVVLSTVGSLPVMAQGKAWTILIYLDADNNLEPWALVDLDEMERGLVNDGAVNVIALVDRSTEDYEYQDLPQWITDIVQSSPQWSGAKIVQVRHDNRVGVTSQIIDDWGNVNMSDPTTLAKFIRYGIQNYPAQHYALIIWDHGGGPGVFAEDEGSRDIMILRELSLALQQAGVHLDIIGFDACLMGMIEAAYEVSNYADYLVVSEESEPSWGWPYDYILNRLSSNPTMSPNDFSKVIVEEFNRFYREIQFEGVTLSAIDLSKYRDSNFLRLVREFIENARNNVDIIQEARSTVQTFGGGDDPTNGANQVDIIDLLDYVENRIAGARELKNLIVSSVISYAAYGDKVARAKGLSIHYPLRYNKEAYVTISSFASDSGWAHFLEEAVNVQADIQPPPTSGGGGEIQLIKLFADMSLEYAQWQGAGPVDFDGDGAQEFLVYGLGYNVEYDEYSIVLSITKYIDGALNEVFTDTIDWGYPDEQDNPPFSIGDAMSGDVDGDGMEEFFDAYSYVDSSMAYANIDRYDYTGNGNVEYMYGSIDNLVVTASDLGDLGGDGYYEIAIGGYEIDYHEGTLTGSLYIVSADDLSVLASFDLDAPNGELVDVPGIAMGEISGLPGHELAIAYNMYQVNQYDGTIAPAGFRLGILALTHQGLVMLDGIEHDGYAFTLDAGDIDLDGQDELVLVYVQSDGTYLEILKLVDSSLVTIGKWRIEVSQQGAAAAEAYDIDGDGIMELLVAVVEPGDQGPTGVLDIYSYIPSTGELKLEDELDFRLQHVIPVPADLNGDKKLEVVYLVQLNDGVYLGVGRVENYVDPTGTVEGVLLDSSGNPVAGAKIKLALPRSTSLRTVTDENGRFVFENVAAGTYQVEAYWRSEGALHHAVQLVTIEAGEVVQVVVQEEVQQAPPPPPPTTTTPPYATTTTSSPPLATQTVTTTQPFPATTSPPNQGSTSLTTTTTAQYQGIPTTQTTQQATQTETTTVSDTASTLTTASSERKGGSSGIESILTQISILVLLIVILIIVRSKKKGAIALLLLFILSTPLVALNTQAAQRPWWAYQGLRITYGIFSGSSVISPWANMEATMGQIKVLGLEGGEQITYPKKPQSANIIGGYEVYIVRENKPDQIDVDEYIWLTYEARPLTDTMTRLPLRVVPVQGVFNGPFWVDPDLLRNAKTGGTVTIPWKSRAVTYAVLYAGKIDISPFADEENSLRRITGINIELPVPKGTFRDVVVLQGKIPVLPQQQQEQTSEYHELVVDRETGLIYIEGLGKVSEQGVAQGPLKNSVYIRVLVGITLDLEDTLPPYHRYQQDPILQPGYQVYYNSMGMAGYSLSLGFAYGGTVRGIYKDTMFIIETLFLSANEAVHQESVYWKVNLHTGEATVISVKVFASSVSNQPIIWSEGERVKHTYVWIGDDVKEDEVEIEGHLYRKTNEVRAYVEAFGREVTLYEFTIAQDTGSQFELTKLYYLPNGLLYTLQPTYQGQIDLDQVGQQFGTLRRVTALDIMGQIPNTQPSQLTSTTHSSTATTSTTTIYSTTSMPSNSIHTTLVPTSTSSQPLQESSESKPIEDLQEVNGGSSTNIVRSVSIILTIAVVIVAVLIVKTVLTQ